ncbi:oligosaccharide flippase family protein [Aliarcobacter cryaerophilus]|uniref:lipopolysaccharide biosynthesis protein n=1 Tax=Aliarcobacter cryaerophilus TaxID=28198 RepID=UPI003DA3C108
MRKIIVQNLSIALLSKAIGFISFIYIAKILSENEYGAFIYITMVLSLLPLLQFGSMHGTVILLPKYIVDPNKNEEELYVISNYISHIIQLLAVGLLFLFNIELNYLIIAVIGTNFFLSHYSSNVQTYLDSHHEFQKANIIKGIEQVLKPSVVLIVFYFYRSIESIFIAQLIVTTIILFISLYMVPFKFLKIDFRKFKKTISTIYKLGFFIYLIWAIDILFRTADKWFISQFYSLEELATYGFTSSLAMNVWLLAMSFFAPYAQVLYKYVAQGKFIDVKNTVESTNKKLYILLLIVSVVAIVAYPFVLELIIKKYFGTEFLFFVLVVSAIFLSINNMYIYYMISNNFHFVLLKYQVFILVLNLMLNGVFAYYHLDILYYSYSTIICLAIYFILVRRCFYIDIENKLKERIKWKN